MKHLIKQDWLTRAIELNKYHIQCLRENPNWTLAKTASTLNRSIGSVSQDLEIASFFKTHEKQLRRCSSARDALSWIKSKKREMRLES